MKIKKKNKDKINMKQILKITGFFTVLFFSTQILLAQGKHYIDLWGGAGYSSVFHGIENSTAVGGIGYNIGVGYHFEYNSLMLQLGGEFQNLNSATKLYSYTENNLLPYPFITDYNITYHYSLKNYKEKHNIGYLNIPLKVGVKFSERYYALVGMGIGVNLFGRYNTSSTLEITATDPVFMEDWENMPTHALGNTMLSDKGKLDFGLSFSPTFEAGVILDDWIYADLKRRMKRSKKVQLPPYSYRIGLFVDYDVTNLNHSMTDKKLLTEPPIDNPQNVQLNGLFASSLANGKKVGSLLVGAKFTVSFFTNKPKKSKPQPRPQAKPKVHPKTQPKPAPIPVFYVQTVDAETHAIVVAEIAISSIADNKQLFQQKIDAQSSLFSKELVTGKYLVKATAEGYLNYQNIFDHTRTDTLLIALQPIKKDVKVVLKNLFFEYNSAVIQSVSEETINELYQFMADNPDIKIQITGHTDNTGSNSYNLNLSRNRARAVHDKLLEKGIAPERISYQGKGSSEPIDTNSTEEGRANNRRVEFVIQ